MKNLDSFDRKILKIVQSNNRVTSEKLAKDVGLSSSACQRRLNSMRKDGVIKKDVSVLDRNKLNSHRGWRDQALQSPRSGLESSISSQI